MTIPDLLGKISAYIINPIIRLAFVAALLIFLIGIVQFINSETADAKRDEGKRKIIWGVFGMFVMFSAYGLIKLVLGTFGISSAGSRYLGL